MPDISVRFHLELFIDMLSGGATQQPAVRAHTASLWKAINAPNAGQSASGW